ncbi:MAG: PhzF family phenazine biosynthesis protein [Acholeplasmatales bacterium]|nr:MAG: PhzF family phenazine biosynthesis protein [Acholeplasmatales bacterium]
MTMAVTLYRVAAFPVAGNGGNEAGVVLDADTLTDKEMLSIAKRVNYSETAFVMNSERADYRLRFFTPTVEVPLCGHATIATFNLMRNLELIKSDDLRIETGEGVLNVRILEEQVELQLSVPQFGTPIDPQEVADVLDLDKARLLNYPIQTVSTGIPEIFVGVDSSDTLAKLAPDAERIVTFCRKHGAVGIYVFTLDTRTERADAQGRNFIPLVGIYEESATGTASGALASYLYTQGLLRKNQYYFEQGYALFKPSCIHVTIQTDQEHVTDVHVGGRMRFIDRIVGFTPEK